MCRWYLPRLTLGTRAPGRDPADSRLRLGDFPHTGPRVPTARRLRDPERVAIIGSDDAAGTRMVDLTGRSVRSARWPPVPTSGARKVRFQSPGRGEQSIDR